MKMSILKRDFLGIKDFTVEEIYRIFNLAKQYKSDRKKGKFSSVLENKTVGLLFNKPSTRTRVSFEVAISELGGRPLYMSGATTQISRGETIRDTSDVLSRYLSGLVIRTYKQEDVEEFAKSFSHPVINALTDLLHPCQILSDYFTIYEKKGHVEGLNVTYIGDGNNVCNSLILGADILGVNIRVSSPSGYRPPEQILKLVKNKKLLEMDTRPGRFISDADVIYTDTWISMGEEKAMAAKKKIFRKYQINKELLAGAKKDFLFMHCLPAHRGWEVTDDVIDSKNSVVIDQAENRLHCQKALLHSLYSEL
ncbi:MAG: ornithine carbamoyltransferase [Candidatus Omnitrophica bacterium]|nr:ornithine carbamoyltransferase [Candidatus Omnitrophota bacterium]